MKTEQHYMQYQLTTQDYLRLYGLMTPAEIINRFHEGRCKSQRSIYDLWKKYNLHHPAQAKAILKQRLQVCCPDQFNYRDWDELIEENTKELVEVTCEFIWLEIAQHEAFFDQHAEQFQEQLRSFDWNIENA